MALKTAEQLRAARAMTRLTQEQVAAGAGISEPTVKRLEAMTGRLKIRLATLELLQDFYQRQGLVFIEENGGGAGVRTKT
jgi:transcriptional regulator with XRE-family HTH domain